jgi:2-keto-4-pentenoate hydratase/2-oxohepta-3-ene-1,7-dioic acid hydratase in catechol pathway
MKIFCIGRNYADHAAELNNPVPKKPMIFMKPATALSNKDFFYYPDFSEDVHYEAEIVLKIIKNGKFVTEEYAASYYEQCSLGIDFTARDVQSKLKEKGHPWEIAKGFDGSAPVGDFIDLGNRDRSSINFSLKKNGEFVQQGNTKDMIFSFDYLISYISKYFTVQVGDLIFTGTPVGVGPVKIGDVLEGFIEGEKLLSVEVK